MKIFTWHIHGTYLYMLSQGDYTIYIPVSATRLEEGYHGKGSTFPFGDNVIEVPVEEVRSLDFDCVLFQTNRNYLHDQYEILSETQRSLPAVYLEHDPPRVHPTDTVHIMQDPRVTFIHVTDFNRLMWDNGNVPTRVIEHGVLEQDYIWTGEKERGIVVINNLPVRGRLLGLDVFLAVREEIPLDLIGLGTDELGSGEILYPGLPDYVSQYRFLFNPIRWTSLGMAVCEAMMLGLPVVGLACTEMPGVIENGKNGVVSNNIPFLVKKMKEMLNDWNVARKLGNNGRSMARERFSIKRFTKEWKNVFEQAAFGERKHLPAKKLAV